MTSLSLVLLAATIVVSSFVSGVFGMAGGMILLGVLLNYLDVAAGMIFFSIVQLFANGWRALHWRRYVLWPIFGWYVLGAGIAFALMFAISFVPNKAIVYHPPSTIPANSLAFGGTWTERSEEATAGNNATLGLQFTADDVYLVMSGDGTVGVSYNGKYVKTVTVSGIPKLYTLLSGSVLQNGTLTLTMSPGLQAYDFTFG